MVIKKNMFGFTIMLLAIVFFVSSFAFAADVVDAAVADFNYCPDGTMVESLADCSDVTDGLLVNDIRSDNARLLVSGDEYGFVTNIDAKATIKTTNGEIFFVDAKVLTTYLDKSSPLLAKATNGDFELDISCGVSDTNEIVCESNHLETDEGGNVFCWGNNELRECPSMQLESIRGGGAGKVSIQDIKIETKSLEGSDGPESSIEVYYQGVMMHSIDPDDDSLALSYVWSVREEPSSSGEPSEDVSLSFSKIEIKYLVEDADGGSGGMIFIDVPEMSVPRDALLFTAIEFGTVIWRENGEVCGTTEHFLSGGDCDDSGGDVRPDNKKTLEVSVHDSDSDDDGLSDDSKDVIDFDDDNDGILTRDESSRAPVHRDVALGRGFITDTTGSMGGTVSAVKSARPNEWSDEDKETIGEYIRSLDQLKREDFALAIAYQASTNERVREVRFNNESNTVEVDHAVEVRLLGFIPLSARLKTTIDAGGLEETTYPWWAVLATKPENEVKFKAGADLSKSVN